MSASVEMPKDAHAEARNQKLAYTKTRSQRSADAKAEGQRPADAHVWGQEIAVRAESQRWEGQRDQVRSPNQEFLGYKAKTWAGR